MKKNLYFSLLVASIALISCDNSHDEVPDQGQNSGQEFTLQVSSTVLTRAGRVLSGSEAKQTVDKVVVYATDNANKVLFVYTIANWQAVSVGYVDGRKYTYRVLTSDKLDDGTYTLWSYAYSTGAVTPTLPTVGATLAAPLSVTFSTEAEEIFAGKSTVTVSEGAFVADASITLYRQVAGAFGYFKNIPAVVSGKTTKTLRLVARMKNTVVNFVEGIGEHDVNGSSQELTTTANFSTIFDPGYTVYSINLSDWFPAGDTNGDGLLGEGDTGWAKPAGLTGVNVLANTVLGGQFMVPFDKPEDTTLELQLVDSDNAITLFWTVVIPADDVQAGETQSSFGVYRNHLYSIGAKTLNNPANPAAPGVGETEAPEDLSVGQFIKLQANVNWGMIHLLGFK